MLSTVGTQLWLALAGVALLLAATATVTVAARTLNRVQRRQWASGSDEAFDEGAAGAVEVAFISLSMARQILLVVQSMLIARIAIVDAGLPVWQALLAAVGAYLVVDKILPYWLVALLGSQSVLGALRPVLAVERLLFALPASYLQGTVRRARHNSSAAGDERGNLGTFLDIAEEEGLVSGSGEALLRGVVEFEDTVVREVMTPRVDVMAIESDATLADLLDLIAEHRLSRIPVIIGDLDHVVGIVNLKDLAAALGRGDNGQPVTSIVRPSQFVPETKRVSELLQEFQRLQEQVAIVVDEYGGTAGLVTLEDVLEEIVGEIQDEDEAEETLIEVRADGVFAAGKAEVADLGEALGIEIAEGEYHTVGGLVFTHLGRVPLRGESFENEDLRFEVLDADERRVHALLVRPVRGRETSHE